MKRLRKQHVLEQSIYGAIWIVIFLLPLIGGYFAMSGGLEREETRMVIRESWLSHKWKNLVKGFVPTAANQLWVADIT